MWTFFQPISARIYFGKTASHRKRARFVQSRGAPPQAYWMSVKAAQQRGCAKRAFCGVCFLVAGGLKPGALVFVSGCGDFSLVFGNGGAGAAAGVSVAGGAGVRSPGGSSAFTGRTGRGFGGVGVSVVFVPVVGCWPAVALSPVLSLGFAASSSTGAATTSSFGCSMTACLISTTVELEMGDITTLGCCCSVIWL